MCEGPLPRKALGARKKTTDRLLEARVRARGARDIPSGRSGGGEGGKPHAGPRAYGDLAGL